MPAYQFDLTADFFIEAWHRFRTVRGHRWRMLIIRWLLAPPLAGLVLLCVALLLNASPVRAASYWAGTAGGGAFLALLLFSDRVDKWLGRRRLRGLPSLNDPCRYELSESGVDVSEPVARAQLAWTAYTAARRLPDGWLLFRGPHLYTWLPDAALVAGNTSETDFLIRTRIADCRAV